MAGFSRVSLLASVMMLAGANAMAQPAAVALPPGEPFPESVTVAADGTLYASSITNGGVARALPGEVSASQWIPPGTFGTRSTFGVWADDKTNTLFVCSNDATGIGIKGPTSIEGAYLKTFDLKTGEPEQSMRLPGSPAICNDVARAPDGALIVTNTAAPELLRLAPGGKTLDVWVKDDRLKGGLDGIAFDKKGDVFVNTYVSGEFFWITVYDGKAGAITKLVTSRPLVHPDALKPFKDGFVMIEGAGTLDRVTIDGDHADIKTLGHFAGPTGVALHGHLAWVSEGQLALIPVVAKPGGTMPSFQLRSTTLPSH